MNVFEKIGEMGIVPVVKIDNAKDAVPLGKALADGGLPIAEITFRTAAAEEAIKNMTRELPEVFVGAGTVLNVEQAKRAIGAGAKFIVCPGFSRTVVEYCIKEGVPVTPGCINPSEMTMAVEYDIKVVKFFPAEASGGIAALKAMSAPFGMLKFIPTGGIDAKNLMNYLSFDKVVACGGSWMVKDDLIKSGNFAEIERLTRDAVQLMLGFDLAHIGINTSDDENSLKTADIIAGIFNFPLKQGNSSNFAGSGIEVVKGEGPGQKGHIAFKTNNITRAIAYLKRKGVEINMDTVKGPEGGPISSVYLKDEIAGFALHLLQSK
jgi:Entner-Doudoroff aldolase